jgi:hypothetical protein
VPSWFRLGQLTWPERWLLLQALGLLPLTALALRLFGYRRLAAALARWSGPPRSTVWGEAEALARAGSTARLVQAAARYGLYPATCLPRALVLWWLLRRQGINGELRLGVRTGPDGLEAHVWVEYAGLVLNDRADVQAQFATFSRSITPRKVSWP